jgi:single-stranded-DNA-specific exonuclease
MTLSVSNKYWAQKATNDQLVIDLKNSLDLSDLVARIISSRVSSINDAQNFLSPKLKILLPDPFTFKDMDKGVGRLIEAIRKQEKICIFADYDVDGATSSALLMNLLNDLDVKTDLYIPNRFTEGYGPTKVAINNMYEQYHPKLMIVVDSGSVAHDALEHASSLGIEVIIIDHHLTSSDLPRAVALINPNRYDELDNQYKYLAAVGVSFIFLVALVSELKKIAFFEEKKLPIPDLMQYLDLVALGTVCDVMPLIHLNRAFVYQGLKILKRQTSTGLRTLMDTANISDDDILSSYHLGFIIGPRINAGGRTGQSDLGAILLSTKSEEEALEIAQKLEFLNKERQTLEHLLLQDAMLQASLETHDQPMVFVQGDDWHQGVIGIIASRLKDRFNKPSIVIAMVTDQDGNPLFGKASCRSVKGVDLGSKIIEAKKQALVTEGGGHAMAGGFSVNVDKIEDLKNFLKHSISSDMKNSKEHLKCWYDAQIALEAVSVNLVKTIEVIEPYGQGNSQPVFYIRNLLLLKVDILNEKHLKLLLKSNSGKAVMNAMWFNMASDDIVKKLFSSLMSNISILTTVSINNWNNEERAQLHIRDVMCIS